MFSRDLLTSITQGFVFKKVLPGILIGLVAVQLDPSGNNDAFSFILYMVTFWAAIGVGHSIAQLVFKSES
jgi:hypothetical protein